MLDVIKWVCAFLISFLILFSVGYALVAFIGMYLPNLDIREWNGIQRAGLILLFIFCGVIGCAWVQCDKEEG